MINFFKLFFLFFIFSNICLADTIIHSANINGGYNFSLYRVAWGDSLTVGNIDGTGVTYPNALQADSGRQVINEGENGDTSATILSRFQAAPQYDGAFNLIWSGRNDSYPFSNVLTNIESMTGAMTSPYLVISVINGNVNTEWSGQTGYNDIIALNNSFAAQYPNNYLDVRSYLVRQYNPSNPEDVIDNGHDTIPTSLKAIISGGSITQNLTTSTQDFTLTGTTVVPGVTIYIGTEKIYVITTASSTEVATCTRGYAGSTAQSFSSGQAFTYVNEEHLNATGYQLMASYINNWMNTYYQKY